MVERSTFWPQHTDLRDVPPRELGSRALPSDVSPDRSTTNSRTRTSSPLETNLTKLRKLNTANRRSSEPSRRKRLSRTRIRIRKNAKKSEG